MIPAAQSLESAGADFALICTNTMHKLYDVVQQSIKIPLLHIADPTAEAIKARAMNRIALLGTRFTMEENFYKDRLARQHGLTVLIPGSEDIKKIHRIIVEELSIGDIRASSQEIYWGIMNQLKAQGAEGIILGCTEIPLLVKESEGNIPLFDTTLLHARAAVEYAIES